VVFRLTKPTSFWTSIVAMSILTPVPESQTSWAEADQIFASGPFMIESWLHNANMTLVPNPHWNGTPPTLERIEVRLGGDLATALGQFQRGELDLANVYSLEVPRVLNDPALAGLVERSGNLSVEYWDFANCPNAEDCPKNTSVGEHARIPGGSPMQNLHFREALTQAIDKTEMIDFAFGGLGEPAYSPTMPGIPGFPTVTDESTGLGYDPQAALASMAIALDELDVAEPRPAMVLPATGTCDETCQHTMARVEMLGQIKFGYSCDAGHDLKVQYMAEQWHEILGLDGDQMDIRCTDNWGWFKPWNPGSYFDIVRDGWGADFPHPDNQNRELFTCGARYSESYYCNPDYDALLDQGAAAATYEDSLPFYHQAEKTLEEDAAVLFLRYGETVRLVQPWVINYVATPVDQQNVGDRYYETIQIAAR
jgi:ABC-type oligopeptide transport system substrate-binding subunit